ncbi:MAG: hypothetical protein LBS28_01460 [Streptococcaceae bacterium]|jgi:predicted AAA+ superfamily ATPase|nr:hypothetical protein [Streptococcaceae bacterium]
MNESEFSAAAREKENEILIHLVFDLDNYIIHIINHIDEVQSAPDLFPYIKLLIDESDKTGQIWLTGS